MKPQGPRRPRNKRVPASNLKVGLQTQNQQLGDNNTSETSMPNIGSCTSNRSQQC